ncbi:hypothetical protein EBZ39_05265 [bacterium]|nr:hypothetical protein [bacterium]
MKFNPFTSELETTGAGGGGGPLNIGAPVGGGITNALLYVDSLNQLNNDVLATRDSSSGDYRTQIAALGYQMGVDFNVIDVFKSDNPGGAPISLVFNGFDDCGTVIAAWNALNPSNTVSLIVGLLTDIPSAQTINFQNISSIQNYVGFISSLPSLGPSDGVLNASIDNNTNNSAFTFSGMNPSGNGTSGFVNYMAVGNVGTNSLSAISQFSDQTNPILNQLSLFASDGATFTGYQNFDQYQSTFGYNYSGTGFSFLVDQIGPAWSDGNDRFYLPTLTTPSVGNSLVVNSVVGNVITLGWGSSAGLPNGTDEFSFWNYDANSNTQQWKAIYAYTGTQSNFTGNSYFGVGAGALSEINPNGSGHNNTSIGYFSGNALGSISNNNTFVGMLAANSALTSQDSVVIGFSASIGATNIQNSILINPNANITGLSNPIYNCVTIGHGSKNGGDNNVVVGATAFVGSSDTTLQNTILGAFAANNLTSGNNNIFLGYNSGINSSIANNNIFIGAFTDVQNNFISNSIALGYGANLNGSHTLGIGGNAGSINPGAIYTIDINNRYTDTVAESYSINYPDLDPNVADGDGNLVEIRPGSGTGIGQPSILRLFSTIQVNSPNNNQTPVACAETNRYDLVSYGRRVLTRNMGAGSTLTVSTGDYLVYCDPFSIGATIDLPNISDPNLQTGKIIVVKDVHGLAGIAGTFTIQATGGETIDFAATYTLSQYESVTLCWLNGNWAIL